MTFTEWKDGKRVKCTINSGVEHNPAPSTKRGKKRNQLRESMARVMWQAMNGADRASRLKSM